MSCPYAGVANNPSVNAIKQYIRLTELSCSCGTLNFPDRRSPLRPMQRICRFSARA
jgi:hypothetical protein